MLSSYRPRQINQVWPSRDVSKTQHVATRDPRRDQSWDSCISPSIIIITRQAFGKHGNLTAGFHLWKIQILIKDVILCKPQGKTNLPFITVRRRVYNHSQHIQRQLCLPTSPNPDDTSPSYFPPPKTPPPSFSRTSVLRIDRLGRGSVQGRD